MRVLVIQNTVYGPVGLFGAWLAAQGARLDVIAPEDIPDAPGNEDLVVTLGSPHGAYEDVPWIAPQRDFLRASAEADRPVIGICFGAQLLANAIGGTAAPMPDGQVHVGWHENAEVAAPVWAGPWVRWHGDHLQVPASAEVLARDKGTVQAFQYRRSVGVQFHPEAGLEQICLWASKMPAWIAGAGLSEARLEAQSREHLPRLQAARDALFAEMLRRTVGERT